MSVLLLKVHQTCRWGYGSFSLSCKRFLQTRAQTKRIPKYQAVDVIPVFRRANNFTDKVALRDTFGHYTYGNLFMGAKDLSNDIAKSIGDGKNNQKVLFLCANDANYVIAQWAIWMSGQIAVPVSPLHPQNLLEYYANDCNAKLLITTSEYADLMQRVSKNSRTKLYVLDDKLRQNMTQKNPTKQSDMEGGLPSEFYNKSDAMILYTSGTTGNPKGAVLTHKNLVSQMTTLIDAWRWTDKDILLHALPLHHVHGIVNALLCPHYIGAKCIMLPKFDSNSVWAHLLGVNTAPDDRRISIFMGVPTMYSRLINEYQKVFSSDSKMVEYIRTTLKNKIRVMICGSAPLPPTIFNKWLEISGHKLLERYGMTEIGMCFSNMYDSEREPGYVGIPLPGVSVRLTQKLDDGDGSYLTLLESTNLKGELSTKISNHHKSGDVVGELQVKGDSVFKEYYNNPQEKLQSFTIDGFFKTGDTAQYSVEKKKFKILGRTNIDIIKTGGYKVSALEIETHLMEHSDIADCAVVGIKDEEWGEAVLALVVLKPKAGELTVESLRVWGKTKMAEYSVPTNIKVLPELPKNSMGKVNKKKLLHTHFDGST